MRGQLGTLNPNTPAPLRTSLIRIVASFWVLSGMLTPCPKTLQNATRYLPGSFETVMWQFQNPPVNGPPLPWSLLSVRKERKKAESGPFVESTASVCSGEGGEEGRLSGPRVFEPGTTHIIPCVYRCTHRVLFTPPAPPPGTPLRIGYLSPHQTSSGYWRCCHPLSRLRTQDPAGACVR